MWLQFKDGKSGTYWESVENGNSLVLETENDILAVRANISCLGQKIVLSSPDFRAKLGNGIEIQNYPEPFNPNTTIVVELTEDDLAEIQVFNSIGKLVVEHHFKGKSNSSFKFNFSGRNIPSGRYFVRVRSPRLGHATKIITLIK